MKKISLLVLLLCGVLFAQASTGLYQKLSSRYGSLTSFQADLSQTNHFAQLGRTISYEGKIYFQPGRMLMSFDTPSPQRLLIHAGKAELYDGSSRTLYRSDILPEFNRMNPIELLQLYWEKSSVERLKDQDGFARVRLIPKNDPHLQELSASIHPQSGIVHRLSYMDLSDNTVSYNFTNIQIDTMIPSAVFRFVYPEDTQIIEQ